MWEDFSIQMATVKISIEGNNIFKGLTLIYVFTTCPYKKANLQGQ
jgi:hypothetical protein